MTQDAQIKELRKQITNRRSMLAQSLRPLPDVEAEVMELERQADELEGRVPARNE